MKISKNYAIDAAWFKILPLFSFQILTLSISGQLSKKYDHAPRFGIYFVLLNFMLLEFEIYNINHAKDEEQ